MEFTELRYQPERTRTYLGSPSISRAPDGALVATHDYFGQGCPRNHEREEALTSVYRSENNGGTWTNITHVMNQYWSTIFTHRGRLYLFGTSQQYGSIVIRRSDDGGFTWTHPADENTGLLFRGGVYHDNPNYHCAPVPVCISDGRILRGFEDCRDARWGAGFAAVVVSAPEDADLLTGANWTMSNPLPFDPDWVPSSWGRAVNPGWLEGNVVEAPDGRTVNILRIHSDPAADKAAVVEVADGGRNLRFDPKQGFIDFPGGMTKFTIRRDPERNVYLTLANANSEPSCPAQRNRLWLCASDDLFTWRKVKLLLADESGLAPDLSLKLTGFQYVDWQFDGDDLIYLVRMAWRGARNFHDANRITFHRLPGFRALL